MFTKGDRAKVLKQITRMDKRSTVMAGEEVTIACVYKCDDGETQIVGIKMDDRRMPMGDIVCFKEGSPLRKITSNAALTSADKGGVS